MLVLTAREWLDVANWEASLDAHHQLVERVGHDKADEFVALMNRIATNLLYTMDTLKVSEASMAQFTRFAASVAIDNSMPNERPSYDGG